MIYLVEVKSNSTCSRNYFTMNHDEVQIHAPGVPFVNCHFKGLQGDTQVKL